MAAGDPAFNPNDAAMALLREMATEARATRQEVSTVRESVARIEGHEIPQRLTAHTTAIDTLAARVALLEAHRTADVAQRKPWVFVGGEIVKLLLAAGAGVAGVWLGLNQHH